MCDYPVAHGIGYDVLADALVVGGRYWHQYHRLIVTFNDSGTVSCTMRGRNWNALITYAMHQMRTIGAERAFRNDKPVDPIVPGVVHHHSPDATTVSTAAAAHRGTLQHLVVDHNRYRGNDKRGGVSLVVWLIVVGGISAVGLVVIFRQRRRIHVA
jgi:hypothetical protein